MIDDQKPVPIPPEDQAVVQLGIDVEHFLNSNLGRYVIKRAESQRDEAVSQLVDADAGDTALVRRMQNEVRLIDMFQQFLADAFTEGEAMEARLKDAEAEAGG